MTFESIPHRILKQAGLRPDLPAYFEKKGGSWVATSWRDYAAQMRRVAKAMIALGLEPDGAVAVLGFNTAEWTLFDVGAMAAGAKPAGIYTTNSPEEVQYITHHCEARLILLEDQGQWDKVNQVRDELPHLHKAVMMSGAPDIDDELVLSWDEFLAAGDAIDDAALDARMAGIQPDGVATLIYTSGTTGPPKGVMLTHDNLAWTADCALQIVGVNENDCSLSYLPLSHIAEQMFTIHVPATAGSAVYYAQSIEAVPENLKEVQPTVFFGVPRIWEKFHTGIASKMADATGVKAKLISWARGVGSKVSALRMEGREPGGLLAMQYNLATKLIFSKLKPAVGMGRARVCVSGAAPIAREVLEFFASLDIIVHEVYGQSEDSGPTSFNQPGRTRIGSVGPAIPGCEVKIAEDGEILVKGRNVFAGYFKDEDATNDTLIDGWLHSGDLGSFDDDGYLYITGRKKEIIITAGGKNIAPKNLEAAMKNHPLINEAVVIGDRRKFLSAVITIDPDAGAAWAEANGTTVDALPDFEPLIADIQAHVDTMNQQFARVEQIKKFRILPRNLSVEEGELTATLKVKRRKVYDHFADIIDGMYA